MTDRFCPTCGTALECTSTVNFGIIKFYKCLLENRFWVESSVGSAKRINLSETDVGSLYDQVVKAAESEQHSEGAPGL